MAVKGSKATVTTAGVKVADATGTDYQAGASVLCVMEGTGPVYVGGTQAEAVANATATQGKWDKTILAALSIGLQAGEQLWMATASSTCVVQVVKTGA
jgi:hypothetical protein